MKESQDALKNAALCAGFNKTVKLLQGGMAERVLLASDADLHLADQIRALCRAGNVPLEETHDKKALGRLCAIQVGCAVAAVKKAEA